jgi:hypothetical protein
MGFVGLIKTLPFRRLRAIAESIKMEFATVPWPNDAPTIRVDMEPDELEPQLRGRHFEGLFQSYTYAGQVLDLRRPEGVDEDGKQLELHVRARPVGGELEVLAHTERSRYEHKSDHINEIGFEWLGEDELQALVDGELDYSTPGVVDSGW